MPDYAGADWIRSALHVELSPFGERVANLIGRLTLGIYHVDRRELQRIDWADNSIIEWRTGFRGEFATFDGSTLTALVVLAHDECIRVSIGPMSNRTVRVLFHPREPNAEHFCRRHPALEEHVAQLREALAAESPQPGGES